MRQNECAHEFEMEVIRESFADKVAGKKILFKSVGGQ